MNQRTDRGPSTPARECYLAIKGMNAGPYSNVGESQNDHTKCKRTGQTEKSSDCMAPLLQHSRFSSVAQSCPTPCDRMDCSTPGFPVHHQLPELAQTHAHQVCDAIPPSHPLSSPSPPNFNLSQHQHLFKWVSSSYQVAKVLELQLQHQSSNDYSGLISFRIDWFDLLAVQGTLKSLLQHHSSKASILQRSAFFMVQLSHPYMTTGKTTALTRQTFVGKVMSLLFNMLSRMVITFLPKSKHLLISWLQSPSAVILEPPKINSDNFSTVSPSISYEMMGPDAMADSKCSWIICCFSNSKLYNDWVIWMSWFSSLGKVRLL